MVEIQSMVGGEVRSDEVALLRSYEVALLLSGEVPGTRAYDVT